MKRKFFTVLFTIIALVSTTLIFSVYATGTGGDCDSHDSEEACEKTCDHDTAGENCDNTCHKGKEGCLKKIEELEVVYINGEVAVTNLVLPVLEATDGEAYYLVIKPMIASALLKIKDGDEMIVEGYLIDDSMLENCRWKQEPYKDSKVVIAKIVTVNGEEYNLEELWGEMHSCRKGHRGRGRCSH